MFLWHIGPLFAKNFSKFTANVPNLSFSGGGFTSLGQLSQIKPFFYDFPNKGVHLMVEPHRHDGKDEGGIDEVRESDGEDERSGWLVEIIDIFLMGVLI